MNSVRSSADGPAAGQAGLSSGGAAAGTIFQPLAPHDPERVSGYLLRARIGEGGMGAVYLSYTPGGRPIALKVVRPEFAANPDFRSRFAREVAIAQRVQGPYTVPVVDADPEATRPWIATAYVPAPSLAVAVSRRGPLPADTALALVAGMAEALQSIHRAGVVHRDLKPGNVILASDGPRVIDFGVARAIDAATTTVAALHTRTGALVGTPAFMAPEQIQGRPFGAEGDVFALGGTAYYAVTGRPPFGTDAAVFHRIEHQDPDWTDCPDRVRDVLASCLAKDPAARPTPAEVIEMCRAASASGWFVISEGWLPPTVAAEVTRYSLTPLPDPPVRLPAPAAGSAPAAGPASPPEYLPPEYLPPESQPAEPALAGGSAPAAGPVPMGGPALAAAAAPVAGAAAAVAGPAPVYGAAPAAGAAPDAPPAPGAGPVPVGAPAGEPFPAAAPYAAQPAAPYAPGLQPAPGSQVPAGQPWSASPAGPVPPAGPPAPPVPEQPGAAGRRPRRRVPWLAGLGATALVAVIAVLAAVLTSSGGGTGDAEMVANPSDKVASSLPAPSKGVIPGEATPSGSPVPSGAPAAPGATAGATQVASPGADAGAPPPAGAAPAGPGQAPAAPAPSAAPPAPSPGPAAPAPKPTSAPAPTSSSACPPSPSHDYNGEGAGILIEKSPLRVGPYAVCGVVTTISAGKKVWLHCSVINSHNNRWWWVRLDGTTTYGWMWEENMKLEFTDENKDGRIRTYTCAGKATDR